MRANALNIGRLGMVSLLFLPVAAGFGQARAGSKLQVVIGKDGSYAIGTPNASAPTLKAGVAAQVSGRWIRCSDYPRHEVKEGTAEGYLGHAMTWEVSCAGLSGQPDLVYLLRAYSGEPSADIKVTVRNTTGQAVEVQSIRVLAADARGVALQGPPSQERVLSDSFSEDRPAMKIHDLGDPTQGMHRAVGSQLLYNRETHQSVFLGTLASENFLTILRLHVEGEGGRAHITGYDVDSTGTTEMELENSLRKSPAEDRVSLSLPVSQGSELASEPVVISIGGAPQEQLASYGRMIRELHHPRMSAPPLMGWWSWTAYYFGLNEGAALTNAEWEAEHLKKYGYNVFHIDEGYQYARGEYTTPNAPLFPEGMIALEHKVDALGLVPGIWTAPFEVSERAWVYKNHPEWLVKNAQGKPIHAGFVVDGKDQLYILDTTNPEAQAYLRSTYSELAHQWGIRYIKMDFMDDSAIEGFYFKPHTTAMEAQRIGLQVIRDAVGEDVYLDKDGSVMLNPVGYVDYGRISQDTGHSFEASRDAATGIAARFFMNENYFIADPDAFTVSRQRITDQTWHEGKQALTLDEAKVSMALAALSGGMLEIGDNLPSLQNAPDREALLENRDLLDMVRLGKAAFPVDLMSYTPADEQPSLFSLKESGRQTMLAVFDWTEHPTEHTVRLGDLGLVPAHKYQITDVLDGAKYPLQAEGLLRVDSVPHSVHMLKIVDLDVPATAPQVSISGANTANAGASSVFHAEQKGTDLAVSFDWDFGDGVQLKGKRVVHAWTEPGDYTVRLTSTGVSGDTSTTQLTLHVAGHLPTAFDPAGIQRPKTN